MLSHVHLPTTGPARALLAVTAGAVYPLGFAPLGWWPLTLLSMSLFLALSVSSPRPLREGWLYGAGLFGVGVSWVFISIHQFGHAPIPLAALMTALFVAALALLFALPAWLLKRLSALKPVIMLVGFPAIWAVCEWFRSTFLTGFPWLLAGYAPIDSWLAGWAPLTGVYGLSWLLALLAASLYLLLTAPPRSTRNGALTALLLVVSSSYFISGLSWVSANGTPLKVALIQGNIDQNLKWQADQRDVILQGYLQPTHRVMDADLILWPETALPVLLDQALPRLQSLTQALNQSSTGLITGAASRIRDGSGWRYHNSIVGLGDATGIYHKQRLVPFGEYVPLENWLRGLIEFFDLPMSSFSLGPDQQAPLRSHNLALAPFICYEIVYPELVREAALQSDLLLTVSNDAWFGDSLAPHQHLQMARMRALENGRQLMRGTNTGITALINHRGDIVAQAPSFEASVLRGTLQATSGTTPFTRIGSWPVLLLSAFSLAGLLFLAHRRSAN